MGSTRRQRRHPRHHRRRCALGQAEPAFRHRRPERRRLRRYKPRLGGRRGSGTIVATTEAAPTGTPQSTPSNIDLTGVSFADASHGWAPGSGRLRQSLILATTDGGATWNPQDLPAGTGALNAISFSDASHGCAWGWDGTTLRTADGGRHLERRRGRRRRRLPDERRLRRRRQRLGSRRQRHDPRHDRRRHQVEGAVLGAERLPLRPQLRRCQPRLGGGMAEQLSTAGVILATTDGGTHWNPQSPPQAPTL